MRQLAEFTLEVESKNRRIEELELEVDNHLDQKRELEELIRQLNVQHEKPIPDDELGNFIICQSDIVVRERKNLGDGSFGSKCVEVNYILRPSMIFQAFFWESGITRQWRSKSFTMSSCRRECHLHCVYSAEKCSLAVGYQNIPISCLYLEPA